MDKLKKFISRKLFVFLLVPIVMSLNAKLGSPLTEEAVTNLVYAAIALILGQSAVDVMDKKKEDK